VLLYDSMNKKLMREGLTKFIASLELDISKDAGEKMTDNLEKLWSEVLLRLHAGPVERPEHTSGGGVL